MVENLLYEYHLYHSTNHAFLITLNKIYVGVYEYLVKSYQGKGDLKTAVIMMKRAIRYETPWDPAHIEELRTQLHVLEEELAKS